MHIPSKMCRAFETELEEKKKTPTCCEEKETLLFVFCQVERVSMEL